jgi:hypothetical protein
MISSIIPAHNEEACLPATLDALVPAADKVGRPPLLDLVVSLPPAAGAITVLLSSTSHRPPLRLSLGVQRREGSP